MLKNAEKISQVSWLRPKLEGIPSELKKQPWAVWIAEPRLDRNGNPSGKYNKAPRNPLTGIKIGANQPEKFGTFEEAKEAYATGKYTGVGVLLTGNGITGIDIDDAQDTFIKRPEVKDWLENALDSGAYCEVSPSGKGYRLFIHAKMNEGDRRKVGSLEIYDDARFLTVTGNTLKGSK